MRSCRRHWRDGWRRGGTSPSTWRTSVWPPRRTTVRDYAAGVGAAIVTKDEDFAIWRLLHGGPAVVWLRLGNTRRLALLARMEAELPAIIKALEKGDELIEIS